MRYAFAIFDEDINTKMTLKAYRFKGNEWHSHKTVQADVIMQGYAQLFAEEFSHLMPDTPIQFISAQLITINNFLGFRHCSLEPFIPGKYEKYTSNAGYVAKGSELAQAFSHFTWDFSGGDMMVTDIQGVNASVLTDPQIHSEKNLRFGRGNLGIRGMDRFFMTHTCNKFCHQLEVRKSPLQLCNSCWEGDLAIFDETLDESIFVDVNQSVVSCCSNRCAKSEGLFSAQSLYSPSTKTTFESGPLLCQGKCGEFVYVKGSEYLQQKKQYGGIFCSVCIQSLSATTCTKPCAAPHCKEYVSYSSFLLSITGEEPLALCKTCNKIAAYKDWVVI